VLREYVSINEATSVPRPLIPVQGENRNALGSTVKILQGFQSAAPPADASAPFHVRETAIGPQQSGWFGGSADDIQDGRAIG
jgi:hypothetical protein